MKHTVAVLFATIALIARAAYADPGIGSRAPVTNLPNLASRVVSLESSSSSVLVVDFFATWCGPCHDALDVLDDLARSDTRVRLTVVAVGEAPEVVSAFFARRPLSPGATVLLDRDGAAARAWGQHRFPTTFIVSADGVIRHINRGYGPGYPTRVRQWIATMMPH